ncbi:hypothetical protein BHE74_00049956, partial [Ensete ventricosum]
ILTASPCVKISHHGIVGPVVTSTLPPRLFRFNYDGRRSYRSDMDPGSRLGIRLGSNDAIGPRWEFARRFAEGIEKLAKNILGDRWRKTMRLIAVEFGGCWIARVRS